MLPRDELYRQIEKGTEKKAKAEAEVKQLLKDQPTLPQPEQSPFDKQS